MSGPTARAERFAAKMQRLAPRIADRFHADRYELLAPGAWVRDGRGGRTAEPEVVEDGACKLRPATIQGDIRLADGRVISAGPYRARLPRDSSVTAAHQVRISGRTFTQVSPPKRPGATGLFIELELEEA